MSELMSIIVNDADLYALYCNDSSFYSTVQNIIDTKMSTMDGLILLTKTGFKMKVVMDDAYAHACMNCVRGIKYSMPKGAIMNANKNSSK